MLTPAQLARIDKHLRSENWLLNNDLIAELTDHYVDAVTEKLAEGVPFGLALQDVHRSFGGRNGLLNMEEKYLKTRPYSRFHLYKGAFLSAFKRPGLGYTLLIFAGCYALVNTLQTAWVNQQIDALWFSDLGWVPSFILNVIWGTAHMQIRRELQRGTLTIHRASPPPLCALIQSAALVTLILAFPSGSARTFMEKHDDLMILLSVLIFVHHWAWTRLIKVNPPKQSTAA